MAAAKFPARLVLRLHLVERERLAADGKTQVLRRHLLAVHRHVQALDHRESQPAVVGDPRSEFEAHRLAVTPDVANCVFDNHVTIEHLALPYAASSRLNMACCRLTCSTLSTGNASWMCRLPSYSLDR